jgi:hypothetical protein
MVICLQTTALTKRGNANAHQAPGLMGVSAWSDPHTSSASWLHLRDHGRAICNLELAALVFVSDAFLQGSLLGSLL